MALLLMMLGCLLLSCTAAATAVQAGKLDTEPLPRQLLERVDEWRGLSSVDCPGNPTQHPRRPPPPRHFSNASDCLCRVGASLVAIPRAVHVRLQNGSRLLLPAGSAVLFGGQTSLAFQRNEPDPYNADAACASVDGGRSWLLLADAGMDPQWPAMQGCYDAQRGMAFLLPNEQPSDPTLAGPALYSTDWSQWQSTAYPPMWARTGANCWVDSTSNVISFNGLHGALSESGSARTAKGDGDSGSPWLWEDLLLLMQDQVHWEQTYTDSVRWYPGRYNALIASELQHGSLQVDVLYVMGGLTFAQANSGGSSPSQQQRELFDLWFSVDDGLHWWPLLYSLPWLRTDPLDADNTLQGASLSASPSGTLVLLAAGVIGPYSSLLASLDGGLNWGLCAADAVPGRLSATLGWSLLDDAGLPSGQERLLVVAGQRFDYGNITAEAWLSSLDFVNVSQVVASCGTPRPLNDLIGLSEAIINKAYEPPSHHVGTAPPEPHAAAALKPPPHSARQETHARRVWSQ